MNIDKENFEAWMERIMDRFDKQDEKFDKMNNEIDDEIHMLDGERLFDNQDLCHLLNVSKRTLQRYRSTGELPFHKVYRKTYYKESDVHTFIRENFNKKRNGRDTPK